MVYLNEKKSFFSDKALLIKVLIIADLNVLSVIFIELIIINCLNSYGIEQKSFFLDLERIRKYLDSSCGYILQSSLRDDTRYYMNVKS